MKRFRTLNDIGQSTISIEDIISVSQHVNGDKELTEFLAILFNTGRSIVYTYTDDEAIAIDLEALDIALKSIQV